MAWTVGVAAPSYDSGFLTATIASQSPTAAELWLQCILVSNDNDTEEWIRVVDGSGNPILPTIELAPHAPPYVFEPPFPKRTGITFTASKNTGIGIQIVGYLTA